MLGITNAPTVPAGDDEVLPEADEPPDDQVPELNSVFKKEVISNRKSSAPGMTRRESLLTRAIRAEHDTSPASPRMSEVPRGMSTTSSHSFASTAELTSDLESPLRSASPSPPPPLNRLQLTSPSKPIGTGKIVIAHSNRDEKPTNTESGEAAIEKTLGRKRCIMFACKNKPSESTTEVEVKADMRDAPKIEPAPRKSRISFACPSRPSDEPKQVVAAQEPPRRQSPPPVPPKSLEQSLPEVRQFLEATPRIKAGVRTLSTESQPLSPFHEFASSHEENEEWVRAGVEVSKPKLTIDDCLKKEHAIRKLGKEAEEEAEAEEREQDEMDNELDDDDAGEDDFAPSDEENEVSSDDGNESDNEEGFAESDSESDAGSDYQFWAPSKNTTQATSTDNMTHFSARATSRSRASSTSSGQSSVANGAHARLANKIKASRAIKMRPGTPELPDSTDFVCGTLDEDRPLEAAYLSCKEQKRREKHIPIPQDIDPSFPTTDPEDEVDDDDVAESSDHVWIKGQFEGFNEDSRGRRPSAFLVSPLHSPAPVIAPPRQGRPGLPTRSTHRSPPPKQTIARSPPPRRLFDQFQRRMRSPPPARLRSPRGSPTNLRPIPFGITINHLAQRPNAVKTTSLPHTPNPFFRNWRNGTQPTSSRITSNAVTPASEEPPFDIHVRGPVDIVIGLEKKRQKRKEKYWRQHCRKVAKEQAEKRPPPGRGAERMKELGLECAERTRGYGLGQPAQLVLSL